MPAFVAVAGCQMPIAAGFLSSVRNPRHSRPSANLLVALKRPTSGAVATRFRQVALGADGPRRVRFFRTIRLSAHSSNSLPSRLISRTNPVVHFAAVVADLGLCVLPQSITSTVPTLSHTCQFHMWPRPRTPARRQNRSTLLSGLRPSRPPSAAWNRGGKGFRIEPPGTTDIISHGRRQSFSLLGLQHLGA